MGELTPLPGISTFHNGFFGSMAGNWPSATPEPFGPRNRDQSAAPASARVSVSVRDESRNWRVIGGVPKRWDGRAGSRRLSQTGYRVQPVTLESGRGSNTRESFATLRARRRGTGLHVPVPGFSPLPLFTAAFTPTARRDTSYRVDARPLRA